MVLQADGTNWNIIQGEQDSGWIVVGSGGSAPAFNSGWSWSGIAGDATPAFREQGDTVHLRGRFGGSAGNATPFTLPAGYRPGSDITQGGCYSGGSGAGVCYIFASTGIIQLGGTAGNDPTMDGISFLVD